MRKLMSNLNLLKLEIYRALLESNGIKSYIKNENISNLKYLLPYNEIIPELWIINDEDFSKAINLISSKPISMKPNLPLIFIGTKNKNKIKEIGAILEKHHGKVIIMNDSDQLPEVEEDGHTFEENASKKAVEFAKFANKQFGDSNTGEILAIADDSGLEVEALFGAPGVHSARYASDDMRRIAKLLTEIERANKRNNENNRKARFVCVIALANSFGIIKTFRGEVYGNIINEPRGSNGFGYDPIFVPDGYELTYAELSSTDKNKISHRAKALKKFEEYITKYYE
ncbi:MAG TPA: RdgB/HAM1 family non-canonical purine NTP pyrophosphatase [Victivallales bacterium]|nr:RdgB/HAM1 family non-canonical purine NTP pyrophosphatase [Victivallales bacterium]